VTPIAYGLWTDTSLADPNRPAVPREWLAAQNN
jgi:hypothetical protein